MSSNIVFLRGKRVNLRPVLRSDIPLWIRWMNDPEVISFLGTFLPVTELQEEQWYERVAKGQQDNILLAIETVDGVTIGNMGLHRISWKDGVAWSGAIIGEKSFWGLGLGTEAKMLVLDYAFNQLNLRKVCSSHFEYNARSRDYQKRCGYREEGRLRDQRFRNGRYWDEVTMAVFRDDWLPLWEQYRAEYLS